MISPKKNQLAQICSEIRSSELCLIVKSIHEYADTAILEKSSWFYRFVEAINVKYDIPKDYRMIEHAILFEASRRYYNIYNSEPTGGIGCTLLNM